MIFEPATAAALASSAMARRSAPVQAAAVAQPAAPAEPSTIVARKSAAHKIILGLVWLTIFSSFFVVREPAPFDVLMLGLIFLLPVAGLTAINSGHLVYLILWLVAVATGFIATMAAVEPEVATTHMAVTLYLVVASFILAAFVAKRPEAHARLIFRAYVAAAVVASTLAIIGYFDIIPGSRNLFVVHARASGTFKDPNVFAPFLVPPMLYLLHETLTRRFFGTVRAALALMILGIAMLLSFSRGGWINLVVSAAVFLPLAFIGARNDRQRIRLIGLLVVLIAAAGLLLLLVLENQSVARLFEQRASLNQSYDQGPEGRFGGQLKAIGLLLEYPFGIGALQFGGIHHVEDVHNVYLSQFLNGGWIGGLVYIVIVLASIVVGTRAVLKRTWPSKTLLVVYAALIGLVVEGFVVETDHWRSFYIVLGLVWGLAYPGRASSPAASQAVTLPTRLAVMPLRPPRRAPRITSRPGFVRMSAVAPKRKRRRREPKRRARIVVH